MNDFYTTNLKAIEHLFNGLEIQPYKEALQKLDEKLTPYLLAENKSLWLVGKEHLYNILPHAKKANPWSKSSIIATEFVKPAPHGKAVVLLKDDLRLDISSIEEGNIEALLQAINPA